MRIILSFLLLILISCNSEKIVELPEISNSTITKITDVSPAYLFYDINQPDSIVLNRKNLISTTHWLVNVDKRLTLQQAIPKIMFLQNKKRDAKMHKNEDAKNYYTCHNTRIQNLGFIEFTNVYYMLNDDDEAKPITSDFKLFISSLNDIRIKNSQTDSVIINSTYDNLTKSLTQLHQNKPIEMELYFSKSLSFQDYISIKDLLIKTNSNLLISNKEFIY